MIRLSFGSAQVILSLLISEEGGGPQRRHLARFARAFRGRASEVAFSTCRAAAGFIKGRWPPNGDEETAILPTLFGCEKYG